MCVAYHAQWVRVWIHHRWLFYLWYPASSCGSPNSLSPGPSCKVHSIFIQLQHVASPGAPSGSSCALNHSCTCWVGRSNCLACDLYQLMWYSGRSGQSVGARSGREQALKQNKLGVLVPAPKHHSLCSGIPDAAPRLGSPSVSS